MGQTQKSGGVQLDINGVKPLITLFLFLQTIKKKQKKTPHSLQLKKPTHSHTLRQLKDGQYNSRVCTSHRCRQGVFAGSFKCDYHDRKTVFHR